MKHYCYKVFQIYLNRFKNELNYPEKMFSVNLDNGLFDIVFFILLCYFNEKEAYIQRTLEGSFRVLDIF